MSNVQLQMILATNLKVHRQCFVTAIKHFTLYAFQIKMYDILLNFEETSMLHTLTT